MLAWGANNFGDLGIGASGLRRTPVRVHLPRGVKVTSASAGLQHSLALTTTGKVLAWGSNQGGELGDGTLTGRNTPVFVHLPSRAHRRDRGRALSQPRADPRREDPGLG